MSAKSLAALKADPRVAEVWQEDDGFCRNGRSRPAYWVALAKGWRDTEADVISLHECTLKEIWARLDMWVDRVDGDGLGRYAGSAGIASRSGIFHR